MKKIKIHVTSEDIERGQKSSCDFCPGARALKRVTRLPLQVGSLTIMKNWVSVAKTPRSLQRFINRFDTGKPVKPFAFFYQPYA